MKELLSNARFAATAGAELLRSEYTYDVGVLGAGGKDLKTLADVAAQELILNALESTGIPVLAEEGEGQAVDLDRPIWIVDPLDGTVNFSRGFPIAAVSIALWDKGKPVLGVVHDIFSHQVYSGVIGQGAWIDDRKICVSAINSRGQAILATGFPSDRKYDTDSLLHFVRSVQSYKKVRMLGSASMMLAQVAAGRFDAYEEVDIYIWDVAAGLALVQAAGGTFSMNSGTGINQYHVRANNGHLEA